MPGTEFPLNHQAPLGRRDPSLTRPVARQAGWTETDVRAVDTIRVLAGDAVQKVGNRAPQ
jgi:transketolase